MAPREAEVFIISAPVPKSANICLCVSQRTAAQIRSRPARSTSSTSASETWAGRYGRLSLLFFSSSFVLPTLTHVFKL